jgi:predicted phage terminase large subunit-like protein
MITRDTINKARVLDAICRTDFPSFIRKCFHTLAPNAPLHMNWHVYALAYHLELVRRGKIKRLIINMPPRSLKSIVSSVAFTAFILGHDPTKRLIAVSYGSELAIKHANDFRAVLNSQWYRKLFPETRVSRTKNTEAEVVTTKNGFRLATSIDKTLTGRGGDIVIIDDPLSSIDALSDSKREHVKDWYNANFPMRLDNKQTGAIIIVMQRLHTEDLTGMLQRSSEEWTLLKLSAIAEQNETVQIWDKKYHFRRVGDVLHPELEPLSFLESIRSAHPETFAAQYQQSPHPPGGVMIQRQWVHYYDQLPERTSSSLVIQSWDTASKDGRLNDWSVCTTWLLHEAKYYLMHVLRERLDYPSLKARAIAHAGEYKPQKILIEDTGIGTALVGDLKNVGLTAIAVKPEHNKKTRMSIQSVKFQSGLVFFPREAPWLAEYQAELFAFPNVHFDDQVDSTAQALASSDHSRYDLKAISDGLEKLCSARAFESFMRHAR